MLRTALAASLVAALACAPAAEAKSGKRCAVRDASVVARNAQSVVLSRTVPDGLGETTEIWGCLRARRRPVLVASAGYDQYASSSIDTIVLRGRFVATAGGSRVIDGTCSAHLSVYSLVQEDRKHSWSAGSNESFGCSSVTAVALTARGRAAFFEAGSSTQAAVHKLDATGTHQLDFGAVDALAAANGEVTWRNGGAARSARLY
jgi:hypothetical protein